MRSFALLCCFAVVTQLAGQALPTGANQTRDGRKEGAWVIWMNQDWKPTPHQDSVAYYRTITYTYGAPSGVVTDYYRNGRKQWQGYLVSDNPDMIQGASSYYDEQGRKTEDAEHKDGVQITTIAYNPDGTRDELATARGQGGIYHNAGLFTKAEPLYIRSLQLIAEKAGKKDPDYAVMLNSLALLYSEMGLFEKAEPVYLEALAIDKFQTGNGQLHYAECLDNLAVLYEDTGQYNKAEPLYLQATGIYKALLGDQHPDYATSLNYLARLYDDMGKYPKAEQLYLQVLAIRKKHLGENDRTYAISLNNLAVLYEETGRFEESEQLYLKAIDILKKIKGEELPNYITYTGNLAKLYLDMGRYEKAEPLYTKAGAIQLRLHGENTVEYADILNGLAVLNAQLGRLDNAEALYLQTLRIRMSILGEDHPRYATTLNNLGALYERKDNFKKAETLLLQAMEIYQAEFGENHPQYAQSLNNLAEVYSNHGSYAKAQPLFEKAAAIRKSLLGEQNATYAGSLISLAGVDEAIQKNEEAERLYVKGLDILKKQQGESHPDYAGAFTSLAWLYASERKYELSDKMLVQSLHFYTVLIERVFPYLSEKEKELFYNTLENTFQRFNAYCNLRHSQAPQLSGEMYNLQLFAKSLLLNNSASWKQRIRTSGDKKLFSLYTIWERNQNTIARTYLETDSVKRKILDSLLTKNNTLEKELSERSELFAKMSDKRRSTWQEVRDKLKPGEAAIEIIRCKKYGMIKMLTDSSAQPPHAWPRTGLTDTVWYAALIITRSSKYPDVVLLKNGNELEKRGLAYYRSSVNLRQKDERSYDLFWRLIENALGKKIKKVYLSPDGVYHSINLNTLYNTKTNNYIIDETDIQVVTNTKDLLVVSREESFNNLAILFGHPEYNASAETRTAAITRERSAPVYYELNFPTRFELSDLPGTQVEVSTIETLLVKHGWKPQLFTGAAAEEEILKDCFKPRVLHIATHGYFQPDSSQSKHFNPLLQSGLMLAGAGRTLAGARDENTEDGILTAYEAVNLNLENTDLVVLSACETGLGQIRNGEGVYGLQRAFKIAGARSIIMSLWKVNDAATQELLTEFYTLWLDHGTKREAFRKAQLELRKKYPDPYFWGAFVIVGE